LKELKLKNRGFEEKNKNEKIRKDSGKIKWGRGKESQKPRTKGSIMSPSARKRQIKNRQSQTLRKGGRGKDGNRRKEKKKVTKGSGLGWLGWACPQGRQETIAGKREGKRGSKHLAGGWKKRVLEEKAMGQAFIKRAQLNCQVET